MSIRAKVWSPGAGKKNIKIKKIKKYKNNRIWPSHFTATPVLPCVADFYNFWLVVSYGWLNQPCQILSQLVKGLWGYGSPKFGVSHWLWMSLLQQCYGLTCYTVTNTTAEVGINMCYNIKRHVLSCTCTCLWAYLKSITVTVVVNLTNVRYISRTPNYTGHCHSCVHCGAAWNASMAEYSVHAADETLLTFELVIAKDGIDTGILYFCYLSNWQKQASNHTKWVRQIHGWSR